MTNVLEGLQSQERIAARKLFDAFDRARNRNPITLGDRQIIQPSESGELNAANPYARILLGNALWSEFSKFFDLSESQPIPEVPLFWLTLVDLGCMTALDATNINVAGMIRHLRIGLRGLSYIGLMEAALYANIQPATNYPERTGVNWHLHLFAWGEEPKAMKLRVKRMNKASENHRPIVPRDMGGVGFESRRVTEENIARRFRYMCKTPRKAYRINVKKRMDAEGRTEFSYISSKSLLRPGERVTLFHLLKNFSLDELTVAGGEGVGLRRRALRHLVRPSGSHHR
ncbi:MAG: hypothetical protein JW395_0045 [Nitrospira sp.]|nr:hypothetical protein [Nitrospira sp.]